VEIREEGVSPERGSEKAGSHQVKKQTRKTRAGRLNGQATSPYPQAAPQDCSTGTEKAGRKEERKGAFEKKLGQKGSPSST